MNTILKTTFLFLFFASALFVSAEVQLPSILGSNMVLQQQSNVKLWGKAEPDKKLKISVSWNKKVYQATTGQDGKWLVEVATPAAGGPYEITFDDGNKLKLTNILIGEVWFCSGQSNMEMRMQGSDRQPIAGSNDVIVRAKPSQPIRMYTANRKRIRHSADKPQENCTGEWSENFPENVANTSAVAYFFARTIQEVLDVPIGIVVSAWGGSTVEAWMSREILEEQFPAIDLTHLTTGEDIKNPSTTACALFNLQVAPLTNFAIKGFLWYQGESNRHNSDEYRKLMSAFVSDLRGRWDMGELPFYYVQIAPYRYENPDGDDAPKIREAQMLNMRDIPRSGMVTTMDVGNLVCIHPENKKAVGDRLAYWALGDTYRLKGFGYKPATYKSMEIIDSKIYVKFDSAPRGLSPMRTQLKSFEIAGEDKVFYPANAEVEMTSHRVSVCSEDVPNPVAVRYAFKNYAEPSIFGIDGIPASPFRTDDW